MTSKPKKGVSLVEALVALVVVSIGLLGLAELELRSMQSNHAAYQASLASVIASDAEERLWFARVVGPVQPETVALVQAEWRAHWDGALPGFTDLSTIVRTNVGSYMVSVGWVEARFGGAINENFQYEVTLP